MSITTSPTRCVDDLCLWVGANGSSCSRATYNDKACASCTYSSDGSLCSTTRAGYQLDCTNVVNLVDMRLCGETLLSQPGPQIGNADSHIKGGLLTILSVVFCIAMGFRAYAEIRRCREGILDETSQEEREDLKYSDEYEENAFSNVEFPMADEGKQPPEAPLPRKSPRGRFRSTQSTSTKSLSTSSTGSGGVHSDKQRKRRRSSKKGEANPESPHNPPPDEIALNIYDDAFNKKAHSNGNNKELSRQSSGRRSTSKGPKGKNRSWPGSEDSIDGCGSIDSSQILPGDYWGSFDECAGDPLAASLRHMHTQKDWQGVRDFFHKIRRRIIERQHYIGLLVKWIAADWPVSVKKDKVFCDYLDMWHADEPDNLQCNVIRLETWIAWAWHGRTRAFAHEIPPERAELYYDRMDMAAAELEEALKSSKKRDALIYAAAIQIATGRNDEPDVVQQYLQAVQASNDPANYNFHTRALEYFCEKWHGSHTEMMDYAKWITSQLPDGHPLWILIPVAHHENATSLQTPAERIAYWHSQQDEIVFAYEKALKGPWETQVNAEVSPACKKLDAVVRNWFVYATGKCRAIELAQTQARVIGKCPLPEAPWDASNTYLKHVKALGFVVDSEIV